MKVLVLIDGEHYPPVTRWAIETARSRGLEPIAALMLGGTEKLRPGEDLDLGLPVTGDLNDPQFSVGPLIWKALTAIITKTVTAPFRALAGLFGGGHGGRESESSSGARPVTLSSMSTDLLASVALGALGLYGLVAIAVSFVVTTVVYLVLWRRRLRREPGLPLGRSIAECNSWAFVVLVMPIITALAVPEIETKRFDTWFFVAVLPEGQNAMHDERETIESEWMEPDRAIERCRRGEIALGEQLPGVLAHQEGAVRPGAHEGRIIQCLVEQNVDHGQGEGAVASRPHL